MIKEAIATGSTVEAAIEAAIAQLGVSRDMAEIQVISLPRKAFLGLFGGNPAKVRAYYEIPDVKTPSKPYTQEAPKSRPAAPVMEEKPKPAMPKTEPVKEVRPGQPRPQPKKDAPKKFGAETSPVVAAQPAQAPAVSNESEGPRKVAEIDLHSKGVPVQEGSKGAVARDFLASVIREMGIDEVSVEASMQGETVVLRLIGESNGLVIGKRGETLDALQYLSSLASNRIEGDYIRVVIDSGNYRERRQQTLERLAAKISASVTKSGRSVTLEPMNPYERRIIHSTVGNIEGVKSTSIGDEPNRRVVISLADGAQPQTRRRFQGANDRRPGGKKPYRNNNRTPANKEGAAVTESNETQRSERPAGGRRFNGNRSGGNAGYNNNNRKPRPNTPNAAPQAPVNPNREKPTEAVNAPMYGKIDL